MYGPRKGFAQTQYFDQMATALAGMLANASDINLVDNAFVGEVDPAVGLMAGIGVVAHYTTQSNRPGLNQQILVPPSDAATEADFAGIVVRNQFMRTNDDGEACYYEEDIANFARRDRAGARIWVRLAHGSTTYGSDVYWIVRDTAGTGKQIGAFSGDPITGTTTPTPAELNGGTVNLNDVKAISNGGFTVSVGGTVKTLTGLDFSAANTMAQVAAVIQDAFDTASVAAKVEPFGNGLRIVTNATGAAATLSFASHTGSSDQDASAVLGLTQATGAVLVQGSAGVATDTVLLSKARFLGTFSVGENAASNTALVELL